MSKLLVGTRGSKLSIAQTQIVVEELKETYPELDIQISKIVTKGDVDKRPLFSIDEKGIFEREVNQAIVKGDIDFAVHSLKDIPTDLSNNLSIACIPKRARPNDVLVNARKKMLRDLPIGSVVGTSSLRRAIQVSRLRTDLKVRPIRGNVETRIEKSQLGEYDAVILAEAGLTRLGLEHFISERFGIRDFVPAPGQGAIAIVCKSGNKGLIEILNAIEDFDSKQRAIAERSLLARVGSGCRFPVGAIATTNSTTSMLNLYVNVFSADGTKCLSFEETGSFANPSEIGATLANRLIEAGVAELAEGWRAAINEWNRKL